MQKSEGQIMQQSQVWVGYMYWKCRVGVGNQDGLRQCIKGEETRWSKARTIKTHERTNEHGGQEETGIDRLVERGRARQQDDKTVTGRYVDVIG
jgi:hypothetical protein